VQLDGRNFDFAVSVDCIGIRSGDRPRRLRPQGNRDDLKNMRAVVRLILGSSTRRVTVQRPFFAVLRLAATLSNRVLHGRTETGG
jgi:hypothetical protein